MSSSIAAVKRDDDADPPSLPTFTEEDSSTASCFRFATAAILYKTSWSCFPRLVWRCAFGFMKVSHSVDASLCCAIGDGMLFFFVHSEFRNLTRTRRLLEGASSARLPLVPERNARRMLEKVEGDSSWSTVREKKKNENRGLSTSSQPHPPLHAVGHSPKLDIFSRTRTRTQKSLAEHIHSVVGAGDNPRSPPRSPFSRYLRVGLC